MNIRAIDIEIINCKSKSVMKVKKKWGNLSFSFLAHPFFFSFLVCKLYTMSITQPCHIPNLEVDVQCES